MRMPSAHGDPDVTIDGTMFVRKPGFLRFDNASRSLQSLKLNCNKCIRLNLTFFIKITQLAANTSAPACFTPPLINIFINN